VPNFPLYNLTVDHRATCYRCFKPQICCICASIEPVGNETSLTILQHPRERFHPVGTARIARLALARVRMVSCAPWTDTGSLRSELPPQTALLYPSTQARDLATVPTVERPQHLIVVDGTWFHARKIYEAHRWLHDLPHVRLTPSEPSRYRIRRAPDVRYLSTIEAIAEALRILEPATDGIDGLLDSFAAMVDRQAAYTAPLASVQ